MMKKILVLFSVVTFLIGSNIYAQKQTSPAEKHGALKVESNQIVNQHGLPPQLRGLSFSWSLWGGKKYYNEDVVDWLCHDFKVTLIRASMGVQPDGGYLSDPEGQKKLMIEVIDQAIKNGIYVLIDWHDHNAEKHLTEAKGFFADMAKKYNGVPNVIYEIWNEPERQSWEVIKSYAESVIQEIRKYDADNLIVVGSSHWDQDVDEAAANSISGYKNICYSFHFYASDPNHQEALQAKADLAIQRGISLFVTEWGVGESNGDGVFDHQKTNMWMEWMEKNKLSWANWNITDKKETTALLQPGASEKGGWSLVDLTESGKYMREKLNELNR